MVLFPDNSSENSIQNLHNIAYITLRVAFPKAPVKGLIPAKVWLTVKMANANSVGNLGDSIVIKIYFTMKPAVNFFIKIDSCSGHPPPPPRQQKGHATALNTKMVYLDTVPKSIFESQKVFRSSNFPNFIGGFCKKF